MRPIGDKLVIATHNPGKLREIAALIEPLGIDLRRRRRARPARARGDRQHLRRQCRSEGARGGRPVAACPRSPTTAACASMRCTAGPASSRRAGPRTRTASATGCAAMERSGARSRRPSPTPRRDAHFVCALAIAWPNDGQAETSKAGSTARSSGRRAATRASATTRCSCRPATSRPSARWIRAEARDQPPRRRLPQAGGERCSNELDRGRGALALYVHWPFCVSKCPYCDFNSHVRATIDQDAWRDALLADLAHEARLLPGRKLTSIFFGGGTPSLMDPATVEALIDAATRPLDRRRRHRDHARGQSQFGRGGALRRSRRGRRQPPLARPAELRRRGARLPRPRPFGARRACARWRSRSGASGRVSFDLIYALARRHARTAGRRRWPARLSLGTGHLSLYQLTIEPGTRFAAHGRQAASSSRSTPIAPPRCTN